MKVSVVEERLFVDGTSHREAFCGWPKVFSQKLWSRLADTPECFKFRQG